MKKTLPLDLTDLVDIQVDASRPGTELTLEMLNSANGIEEMAASCAPACSCCIACCCCCPHCS